jgi:membrane associated rhomboid family serine protease
MLPLRDHLPTRTFPFVNYAIIAANVAVFVLQLQGAVTEDLAFVPARLFTDPVVGVQTLFIAMFMHASVAHIAGNMLFLWIFGDNVEDAMGHFRYLLFYLVGGVCAAAAQTLASPNVPMLGASGAISAVLAAYVLLYPRSPVTVLNPVWALVLVVLWRSLMAIPLIALPLLVVWFLYGLFLTFPAWLVIGLFFVVNLGDAVAMSGQGGIAFMAHVGGFVGGMLLYRAFLVMRPRMSDYTRWQQWGSRRPQRRAW